MLPVRHAAHLARITDACIGCMLCIPSCPTGAIEGEAKHRHTVTDASCTGCGLCVPVCPVEAISLAPQYKAQNTLPTGLPQALRDKINAARAHVRGRYNA